MGHFSANPFYDRFRSPNNGSCPASQAAPGGPVSHRIARFGPNNTGQSRVPLRDKEEKEDEVRLFLRRRCIWYRLGRTSGRSIIPLASVYLVFRRVLSPKRGGRALLRENIILEECVSSLRRPRAPSHQPSSSSPRAAVEVTVNSSEGTRASSPTHMLEGIERSDGVRSRARASERGPSCLAPLTLRRWLTDGAASRTSVYVHIDVCYLFSRPR